LILSFLITYFIIVPILKKNCLLDKSNCENITYQIKSDGQILLRTPNGYTYWITKDYIYAYGDYTGSVCPTITSNNKDGNCDLYSNDGKNCLCYNLDCNEYGVCKCKDFIDECQVKNKDGTCKCALFDSKNNKCLDPQCKNSQLLETNYNSYLQNLKNLKCSTNEIQKGAFVVNKNLCYQNENSWCNYNNSSGTTNLTPQSQYWSFFNGSGGLCGSPMCTRIININGIKPETIQCNKILGEEWNNCGPSIDMKVFACTSNSGIKNKFSCGTKNDNSIWEWGLKTANKIGGFIFDYGGEKLSTYQPNTFSGKVIAEGYNYTPVFVANSKTYELVPGQLRCVLNLEILEKEFQDSKVNKLNIFIDPSKDQSLDIFQIVDVLKDLKIYN